MQQEVLAEVPQQAAEEEVAAVMAAMAPATPEVLVAAVRLEAVAQAVQAKHLLGVQGKLT